MLLCSVCLHWRDGGYLHGEIILKCWLSIKEKVFFQAELFLKSCTHPLLKEGQLIVPLVFYINRHLCVIVHKGEHSADVGVQTDYFGENKWHEACYMWTRENIFGIELQGSGNGKFAGYCYVVFKFKKL